MMWTKTCMFENLVVEMIYPLNWPRISSITYIVIIKKKQQYLNAAHLYFHHTEIFKIGKIVWQCYYCYWNYKINEMKGWICFPFKHILLISYHSYILARQIRQVPPLNKFSQVWGQTSSDLHICHNMVTEYRNSSHKSSTEHSLLMGWLFPERENYWVYLSTLS